MEDKKKYVIIGGGAAGIEAAEELRKADADASIMIIMEDELVHSRCMLHKFLSGERDARGISFLPEEIEARLQLRFLRQHTVCRIDTERQMVRVKSLADGAAEQEVAYNRLLIATGSNGAVPPVGELHTANNVHCFRHLSEAEAIARHLPETTDVVVIGAGLVGIDAAYAFLEQGKNVTVVEMAPRIIPMQLDDEAAATYQALFEKDGCRFLLSRKVVDTESNGNGGIAAILLDDGSRLACDLVVTAAGERAALTCCQDSGITYDRFLTVDDHMRTNVPNVYAAGNVTGLSGTWPNAKKQAVVAARNMLGEDAVYDDTYALKNTMNFYGLATLSLGRGEILEGDRVIRQHDSFGYRRAIVRDGKLDSIIVQGRYFDYAGVYQYVIKNGIDLSEIVDLERRPGDLFRLSFAQFFGTDARGQYRYAQ